MLELTLERLNWLQKVTYPFVENSVMTGSDGTVSVELPVDAVLDVHMVAYASTQGSLRLVSAVVAADEASVLVTFRYEPLNGSAFDLPVTVPASAAAWESIEYYRTGVYGVSPEWSFWPVFGKGVVNLASGHGGKIFVFDNLLIEPACVQLRYKHVVMGINSPSEVRLTGNVKVRPGYNMMVAEVVGSNSIRLSAIVGEGEGMPCRQLAPTPGNCADLIYSINGATPDWYGDFVLEGGPGITITADKDNHKIIINTTFQACNPGCRE